MTDRELMQPNYSKAGFGKPQGVINTLNKQPEPEPVAWMRSDKGHIDFHKHPDYIPLYTAPPQRKWQGLTDEEMREIWDRSGWYVTLFKAVEAKLKAKNG